MPYIDPARREALQSPASPQDAGELNYAISFMVHRYVSLQIEKQGKLSYALLSAARAVLQDANDEFYRTVVAPYEDVKRADHGSVSLLDKSFSGTVKNQLTGYDVVKALASFAQRQVTPHTQEKVENITITVDASEAIALMKKTNAEIAENKPAPESFSTKRRPSQVVGVDPGGVDGVQRPIVVAAAEAQGDDGSVASAVSTSKRTKLIRGGTPRGHTAVPVNKAVQSVWEDAVRGNGEDNVDDI